MPVKSSASLTILFFSFATVRRDVEGSYFCIRVLSVLCRNSYFAIRKNHFLYVSIRVYRFSSILLDWKMFQNKAEHWSAAKFFTFFSNIGPYMLDNWRYWSEFLPLIRIYVTVHSIVNSNRFVWIVLYLSSRFRLSRYNWKSVRIRDAPGLLNKILILITGASLWKILHFIKQLRNLMCMLLS